MCVDCENDPFSAVVHAAIDGRFIHRSWTFVFFRHLPTRPGKYLAQVILYYKIGKEITWSDKD